MTNHTLLIMRHAKSDWDSKADNDFDRPLNQRGQKDASKMGAWLKEQNIIPDRIVSSPALRAKQTILNVCKKLDKDISEIIWDERIYEARLDDLLQVITDHGSDVKSMLLTGHNPGLDHLLNHLLKERPPLTESGKLMTTAAIAMLEFGEEKINGKRQAAKLLLLARPKEIRRFNYSKES
jgi:phosphohistidine phosphatase